MDSIEKKVEKLYHYLQTSKDKKEAYKLAQELHDLGKIEGTYVLAGFYFNGIVLEKNRKEAVSLLQICANKGHQGAKYNLAISLFRGEGVEQDINLANKMMNELVRDDFPPAVAMAIEASIANGSITPEGLSRAGIKPVAEFDIPMSDLDTDTLEALNKLLADSPANQIGIPITVLKNK